MFLTRPGIYRSKEPTPTLAECQDTARYAIVFQLAVRGEKGNEISLQRAVRADAYLGDVSAWLAQSGNDATKMASTLATSITSPAGFAPPAVDALRVAAAYWHESKSHAECQDEHRDTNRAWAALLQCYYFIGQASGPVTLKEGATLASVSRNAPYEDFRKELLGWLSELPEKSQANVTTAIKAVMSKALDFAAMQKRKSGDAVRMAHGDPKGLEVRFKEWSRTDPTVRAAFVRVCGPISPGRPRKS